MSPEKPVPRGTPRRKSDQEAHAVAAEKHSIRLRENWYRDVWLLIITAVVLWSVFNTVGKVERQREGRAVAVNVVCGATSAIIEAGRATITGGGVGPPEFVRALEELGFPPKKKRQAAARMAAKAYAKSIADAVEEQSGVEGLVRENGSLRCDKLRVVTQVK